MLPPESVVCWVPTSKLDFGDNLIGQRMKQELMIFGDYPEDLRFYPQEIQKKVKDHNGYDTCQFPCCKKQNPTNLKFILCVKHSDGQPALMIRIEPDGKICGYPNRFCFPICIDCMKYPIKTQRDILFWFMGYDPSKPGNPVLASIETGPPYLCNIAGCRCEGYSPSYFRNEYNFLCEYAMQRFSSFYNHRDLLSTIAGSYAGSISVDSSDFED